MSEKLLERDQHFREVTMELGWIRWVLFLVFSTVHVRVIANGGVEPSLLASNSKGIFGFLFDERQTQSKAENTQFEDPNDEPPPVELDSLVTAVDLSKSRPWRAPNYSGQKGSLGYREDLFHVSEILRPRVDFWKKIYTEYTTSEGLLHDAENPEIILGVVSFRDIEVQADLSSRQKKKQKELLVKEAREQILDEAQSLSEFPPWARSELTPTEQRLWVYLKGIRGELSETRVGKNRDSNKNLRSLLKNRIRFQLGQKDRFFEAVFLSGRYLEEFEKIFAAENLPIELTRLVFVESSFNVLARSKVGASGLWQIMPSTARPFKYIKDHADYRNDPWRSTHLAAKVLRMGYEILEDWPLAITGYNHGPTGILKLTRRYKSRDLGELIEMDTHRRSFGFASRNFFASFLAALEVERDAKKYFRNPTWSLPLDIEAVKLSSNLNHREFKDYFEQNPDLFEVANPHLHWGKIRSRGYIPQGTWTYIPKVRTNRDPSAAIEISSGLDELRYGRPLRAN